MEFREAVSRKIRLDVLTQKVRNSLVREGGGIDKESMRALFEGSGYRHEKIRDLELYILEKENESPDIIVLDKGLDRYRTGKEDVALRKSPTIKEMISIRNARKILSDGDVLVSRKEKTLTFLHDFLVEQLDFSWSREEILTLARDGAIRLEAKDEEGVVEVLEIFAELLGLSRAPAAWRRPAWWLYGRYDGKIAPESFRDLLAFNGADFRLFKVLGPFEPGNIEDTERLNLLLLGSQRADFDGKEVLDTLAEDFWVKGQTFYREQERRI